MSLRGPSRARGLGRGRGRGRGKTMIWEWETYKPSPAVYDNLWHIRQAPVPVTPNVPNDCPIPDARTRILERRQTEDGYGRNFYFVEMTYIGGQEPTSTWVQSSDRSNSSDKGGTRGGTEVERVDVSRILQYVSPRELERFENEQFRIEAEAQAVADREEREEQIRRRLQRNARTANGGRGRGGRILDGFGIDLELQATGMARGRGKGRPRGRGRGKGSWRGRGGLMSAPVRYNELAQDEIVDSEPSQALAPRLPMPTSHDDIAATSTESDDDLPEPASPGLMRSAFITNSALPLSPVQPRRPAPATSLRRAPPEVPDIDDPDIESGSISSAAEQLQLEGNLDFDAIALEASSPVHSSVHEDHTHPAKRRRTASTTPQHTLMFPPSSQIADSDSEADSIPADPPPTAKVQAHHNARRNGRSDASPSTNSFAREATPPADAATDDSSPAASEDAEEYVISAILEHYYDDHGRKFYLVKWDGYEDSHDWLPEEDLQGAQELVGEYKERVRRQKGKARA